MPTQVPNSGYVETVYFNTSLTKEEVHNILSGLNFANAGAPNGMLIYMPFVNADYSCNIEIDYYPTTNEYSLSYTVNGVALRIFDSTNHDLENGWDNNYSNVYNVNSENTASSIMAQFSVEMQNDKLTQLISITPFEEPIALKPFLKGIADAIREKKKTTELINAQDFASEILSIKGGLIEVTELPEVGEEDVVYKLLGSAEYFVYEKLPPLAVPTSGTISNVYINPIYTAEEMQAIIEKYATVELQGLLGYPIAIDTDTGAILGMLYNDSGFYTIGVITYDGSSWTLDQNKLLYHTSVTDGTPVFNTEGLSLNWTTMSNADGIPIGSKNDELSNLISITPDFSGTGRFKQISGGFKTVDVLPSVGNENYTYILKKDNYEIYAKNEELGIFNFIEYAKQNGASSELVGVFDSKDQLPTENIKVSNGESELYFYYVRNDDLYLYGPFSEDGNSWGGMSDLMFPFGGEITDTSEITATNTLYVLNSGGIGGYYIYDSTAKPVPNKGTISEIYFNTSLSVEEVVAELSKLTYSSGLYVLLYSLEPNKLIWVTYSEAEDFYTITDYIEDVRIFVSSEKANTGFVGWNTTVLDNGKYAFENPIELVAQADEVTAGAENSKITNVVRVFDNKWTKISGGGATVKATPEVVPNTGYVEKVYLNKSLSFDEVNAICTKANSLVANELPPIYGVVSNNTFDKQIIIMKLTDQDGTTFNSIHYPTLGNVIWSERDYYNEETDGSITQFKKGWMFEKDYVEINSEVVSFIEGDFAVNVGQHNDQLTELFSINNVFKTEEIQLSEEYDGSPITVTNMVLQGTEIPTTGTIGTVYCNTSMSVEEVVKVLKTLTYETDGSNEFCSVVVTLDRLIRIIKTGNVYGILDGVMLVFVSESVAGTNFVGWNPEYTTISVNQESTLTDDFVSQNDKLKNILSITPFEEKQAKEFSIDIKSLLEQNKLPLSVTVNVKGIELNPVTNIALSSSGLLTWDAPDTTEIADKLVSISYVVNVNGTELTSDTNSISVIDYVVVGENTVIVKAIIALYNEETQSVVEYEAPQVEVITLSATLPKTTHSSPVASYQKTLYVFNVDNSSMICKFDTETETVTTLSATTTPNLNYGGCAITIGTNIYIFGGDRTTTIFKFDTETETVTTLSATMPNTAFWFACNVDKLIYLLSGNGTYICKFDTETETVTTLDINNSSKRNVCCNINNKIYWIDGYSSNTKSKIYKFDTETETISDLGEKFTFVIGGPNTYASIANDKEIYIFGYGNSTTIYKFDTETETVTTLDVTLNYSKYDVSCGVVNKTIYLIGGRYPAVNTIMKITNLI